MSCNNFKGPKGDQGPSGIANIPSTSIREYSRSFNIDGMWEIKIPDLQDTANITAYYATRENPNQWVEIGVLYTDQRQTNPWCMVDFINKRVFFINMRAGDWFKLVLIEKVL